MTFSGNGTAHFDAADRLADAITARVGKSIVRNFRSKPISRPALQVLKSAAASPLRLGGILARGLKAEAHATGIGEGLARMGLDRPSGVTETVYAAPLRGALPDSIKDRAPSSP
jgi:hypothetical protein